MSTNSPYVNDWSHILEELSILIDATKILQREVLDKHSLCTLLASDLVITILGLSSSVVSLPTTSIPSIVIGCLSLLHNIELADTSTGILGGSRLHDGIKS